MKILLATNYLKGSLSALKTAQIIKRALLKIDPKTHIDIIPIADGGDGTLEAIQTAVNSTKKTSSVLDPLQRPIKANWLILKQNSQKIAVIEAAQANGINRLKPKEYNPLQTSSYGVGQLIKEALIQNCSHIIITLGGSSTNDGGIGIIQALGGHFLDHNNQSIGTQPDSLKNLSKIDLSNLDPRLSQSYITVACDVNNPLCGPQGATFTYGPQKGATKKNLLSLEQNLNLLADKTFELLNTDYRNTPGTGAAGGIGFALKAFLNANIISGFDLIAKLANIHERIKHCNLIITTEGRLDSQSLHGKAPYQIAKIAHQHNIPTIVFAGSIERNLNLNNAYITSAFSLTDGPLTLKESINDTEYLLENISKQVFSTIKAFSLRHPKP